MWFSGYGLTVIHVLKEMHHAVPSYYRSKVFEKAQWIFGQPSKPISIDSEMVTDVCCIQLTLLFTAMYCMHVQWRL